jgi:hypothetical protein
VVIRDQDAERFMGGAWELVYDHRGIRGVGTFKKRLKRPTGNSPFGEAAPFKPVAAPYASLASGNFIEDRTAGEKNMKSNQNRIAIWAIAALLSLGLGRNGAAQTSTPPDTADVLTVETVELTVYRTKEPSNTPAAKPETRGTAPAANTVWVPGYWDLRADRNTAPRAGWAWVPGRWATPPAKAARWDPAHWGWASEWWSWIPGHWVLPGKHGYPPSLQSDQMSRLEISQ